MNGLACVCVGGAVIALMSSTVQGFEFRTRWVERVGNTDIETQGNVIQLEPGESKRMRLQFGIFDDAVSAAPAGGFLGWNSGTLEVSGSSAASENRRTPGRLAPFDFFPGSTANGTPTVADGGDPFLHLASIDNTLGIQSLAWMCDANGAPLPIPQPVIRGRNTFVSLYEITTTARPGAGYTVTAGGDRWAATEWRLFEPVQPPDCSDPGSGATTVIYGPIPLAGGHFTTTLTVIVPAAPSGSLIIGMSWKLRRRRCRNQGSYPGRV